MVTMLAGRYRLGDQIGAGGSAKVFHGHDERLGRDVAVKVLDDAAAESADPAARERFASESQLAAKFVHPNAVTIFDAGSEQGYLFLVTELLTGGTLAGRLATSGPMDSPTVRLLATQLGGALAAGHAAGIIHRDVKPSNVLLADDGTAKLADFGIARRFDEIEQSLTSTGMVMGTRGYVSPEQAAGRRLTPATDVFSLGVVLYEAATGTRPRPATERSVGDVLDVTRYAPGIDPALAHVISTATAVELGSRFASMPDLLRALDDPLHPAGPIAPAVDDETATMPAHLRPAPVLDGLATTNTAAAAPPPPDHHPQPDDSIAGRLDTERRRRRVILTAAAVSAILLAGSVAVAATVTDDDRGAGGSVETSPSGSATPRDSAATTSVTTTNATTTTSVPDTTTSGPTTTIGPAPTTAPAELIPGFPVPSSADEFLTALQADPEIAGRRGKDLARELERILDGDAEDDGDRRGKDVERLIDKIDSWVEKDEIDPTIARTATVLVAGSGDTNPDDDD